jgi:hypothetical protein
MNSRRYRFATTVDAQAYADEWAATLDVGIERAKKMSKDAGVWVYLVDAQSPPFVTRGVAREGKWIWMITCKACRGSGEVTLRPVQVPGGPRVKTEKRECGKCFGRKFVEDHS